MVIAYQAPAMVMVNTTLISDKSRVYKGGSWNDRAYWLSPGTRRFLEEDQSLSTLGFRCAMDRMGSPEGNGRKTGQYFPTQKTKTLTINFHKFQSPPSQLRRAFY